MLTCLRKTALALLLKTFICLRFLLQTWNDSPPASDLQRAARSEATSANLGWPNYLKRSFLESVKHYNYSRATPCALMLSARVPAKAGFGIPSLV